MKVQLLFISNDGYSSRTINLKILTIFEGIHYQRCVHRQKCFNTAFYNQSLSNDYSDSEGFPITWGTI